MILICDPAGGYIATGTFQGLRLTTFGATRTEARLNWLSVAGGVEERLP